MPGYIPEAEYRGPLPDSNFARTNDRHIIGMTVHHMDGSWQSAEGRFKTPGAQASAVYGTRYDGSIIAWLDPDDEVDYHACMAQWEGYIGVENESDPNNVDAPLTDAQVAANARIAKWHGIPGVAITQRGQAGVGYHRQFPGDCSECWGQTDCPGDGIVNISIPAIVAAINGAGPSPTPSTEEDDDMTVWLCLDKTTPNLIGAWVQEGPYMMIHFPTASDVKGNGRVCVVAGGTMALIIADVNKARVAAGIK